MKIVIDADSCPNTALQYCKELGEKYNIMVFTVANKNHKINSVNHISVRSISQETDMKIINMTNPNDIIITQDYILADTVMQKKAFCINANGDEYGGYNDKGYTTIKNMGDRQLKGKRKRSAKDNIRFRTKLEAIIQIINEQNPFDFKTIN